MVKRLHHTPWIYRYSRPLIGGIATTGAVITAYLTAEKLLQQKVACPTNGCEQVLDSAYATVFGLPLSLWGLLTYVVMAILAFAPLIIPTKAREQKSNLEKWTAWLLFIGSTAMVIFGGYLMYLLAFKLHALCIYCITSAIFSISLWLIVINGRDWTDDIGQLYFVGVITGIVTLVATLAVYSSINSKTADVELDKPISADFVNELKQVSQQGLTYEGSSQKQTLKAISAPPINQKPEVLYFGADYCPFCAGFRWSLILALLRFGDFNNLSYMSSSPIDSFPNTSTFSFYKSSYQSSLLNFESVELQDRSGKQLQNPTPSQQKLFEKFNAAPYTDSPGAIPFLYVAGKYLQVGASFVPTSFQGLSWEQIAKQLHTTKSPLAQTVLADTNSLTAAFCQVTNNNPGNVCQAPGVKAAAKNLPVSGSVKH